MNSEQLLEHHGVKGMKWGVRNDKGHEGEAAKTSKIRRLDKKFARGTQNLGVLVNVRNRAAKATNENDVDRINNKPAYKDQDFSRDSPLRQRYYAEHKKAMLDNLEKAASELGTNASGTKKYSISESPNGDQWDLYLKDVKHASEVEATIKLHFDAKGYITSIEIVDPVAHSSSLTKFLEHYGVRGMRWGVRTKSPRRTLPKSSDYKKTAELRKRKKSQLTNKQLDTVNTRLNKEKNFKKLNPSTVEKGHGFAKATIALGATGAALFKFSQTNAGQATIEAGKDFIANRMKFNTSWG